ncbi:uncharacterized protein LOC143448673 [Clavelina lepadiformis]|uniref:uncharacterized protein LOC143448673 n=1 Tax=Clavelina lepadiformis TaxID=159417 RepID=UPI004042FA2A
MHFGRFSPPIHFIYFRSSELDNRFVVNGNEYDTPFILVDDKNQPFRCITVPEGTNEQNCPKEFKDAVIFNKTYFQLPDEFEERKTIRTASQIDLCCGSAAFYPSFVLILVFLALSVIAAY